MSHRTHDRDRIAAALAAEDFEAAWAGLCDIEPKRRLAPLYSALLAPEPRTRWRAAVAMGAVAAELAATRPEEARDLMRNCMWRLNEESGTVGWGIPEVMGEALARSPLLAEAYHRILIAYVRDLPGQSSYLDHAPLRRGVWWAVARLAEVRPELARQGQDVLTGALADPDPTARGLACLALARLGPPAAPGLAERLGELARDPAGLEVFADDRLETTTVAALAAKALHALGL